MKLHKISLDEAVKACLAARTLVRWLKIYRFAALDFKNVVKIAVENNITIYGAAYIALAITLRAQIASEDRDIIETVPKYKVNRVTCLTLFL